MKFVILIAISALIGCTSQDSPQEAIVNQSDSSTSGQTGATSVTFKSIVAGRAKTKDGVPFSFHSYQSSVGPSVSTSLETHTSKENAGKKFELVVGSAIEVIEKPDTVDERGIRKRAILRTKVEDADGIQFTLIGLKGEQIYMIESSSLDVAISFEKAYEPAR